MNKDYIVQYIVVRRDLINNLGIGIMTAQICHASLAPVTNQLRRAANDTPLDQLLDSNSLEWIKGPFNKVILEVEDKSTLMGLMQKLDNHGIIYYAIRESKLEDEITCIGLKPYLKSYVTQQFRELRKLR